MKEPKFHKLHYNLVAKILRERLEFAINFHAGDIDKWKKVEHRGRYYAVEALVQTALDFTHSFKKDNPDFDPLQFLDQCSPNEDLYPLSELWEEA
jgi:hypothetical protein